MLTHYLVYGDFSLTLHKSPQHVSANIHSHLKEGDTKVMFNEISITTSKIMV